jgi:catechol 2,3-dioxygenase-like lactoylglutathione lyase family enzyme
MKVLDVLMPVVSADPEATVSFYRETLGLPLKCVFRSTRAAIPPAPGHPFQSTRARSERSDGTPSPSCSSCSALGGHLSQGGDAWMISPGLPSSLPALSPS